MSKRLDTTIRQINDNLEISTRYIKQGQEISNHWHDYYEFEMVLEGEYEHVVNTTARRAKRGSAWIMCPLDFHSLKAKSDTIIINISFTGQDIDERIVNLLSCSTGGFLCEYDEADTCSILEKALLARNELQLKPSLWESNVTGLVQSILIKTIRHGEISKVNTPPRLLQGVVSYLNKNYTENLSLAALADKFYMSPGHLGLIFSKTFGTSLSNYVNRIRLRHACNMLTNSSLSTKEIAHVCGFGSVEYFFYVFKKHLGETPNKYRQNTKQLKNLQR